MTLRADRGTIRLWIGNFDSSLVVDKADLTRGIAVNIGMPFKTPEEFFLGQAAEPATGSFDPMSYIKDDLEEPGMYHCDHCTALTAPADS